jgi:hypothetical protein
LLIEQETEKRPGPARAVEPMEKKKKKYKIIIVPVALQGRKIGVAA